MRKNIYRAEITCDVFVSAISKSDAREKVLHEDRDIVLNKSRNLHVEIEDTPYEILGV